MSIVRTGITLVIAAALALLAWRGSADSASGEADATSSRLLEPADLPIAEVTRIDLTRTGGGGRGGDPSITLTRRGDEWWQEQPFPHRLQPFSARQLMVQALELFVAEVLPPEQQTGGFSPTALSLVPPLASVTYHWPEGSLSVRCGLTGLAGRAYVRVNDDPTIYVVGQGLHERAVTDDPREWRDRRLFASVGADADRIEMITRGRSAAQPDNIRVDSQQRTVLVRDGRRWTMQEPARTRVDPVVRDALMQAIGRASSRGYIIDQPADLARFGLAEPEGEMRVTSTVVEQAGGELQRTPSTQRLLVGARIGGSQDRFGMMVGTPAVFRLPAEAIVSLFRDPRELADPTGSGTSPADVKSIVIRRGDAPDLILQRDLERWTTPNPGSADPSGPEVQAGLVEELLRQVTELRASKVELEPYPRDLEAATITLVGYDDRPLDTIRIVRSPETSEWGLENGDDVIRVLPESVELRLTREEYE